MRCVSSNSTTSQNFDRSTIRLESAMQYKVKYPSKDKPFPVFSNRALIGFNITGNVNNLSENDVVIRTMELDGKVEVFKTDSIVVEKNPSQNKATITVLMRKQAHQIAIKAYQLMVSGKSILEEMFFLPREQDVSVLNNGQKPSCISKTKWTVITSTSWWQEFQKNKKAPQEEEEETSNRSPSPASSFSSSRSPSPASSFSSSRSPSPISISANSLPFTNEDSPATTSSQNFDKSTIHLESVKQHTDSARKHTSTYPSQTNRFPIFNTRAFIFFNITGNVNNLSENDVVIRTMEPDGKVEVFKPDSIKIENPSQSKATITVLMRKNTHKIATKLFQLRVLGKSILDEMVLVSKQEHIKVLNRGKRLTGLTDKKWNMITSTSWWQEFQKKQKEPQEAEEETSSITDYPTIDISFKRKRTALVSINNLLDSAELYDPFNMSPSPASSSSSLSRSPSPASSDSSSSRSPSPADTCSRTTAMQQPKVSKANKRPRLPAPNPIPSKQSRLPAPNPTSAKRPRPLSEVNPIPSKQSRLPAPNPTSAKRPRPLSEVNPTPSKRPAKPAASQTVSNLLGKRAARPAASQTVSSRGPSPINRPANPSLVDRLSTNGSDSSAPATLRVELERSPNSSLNKIFGLLESINSRLGSFGNKLELLDTRISVVETALTALRNENGSLIDSKINAIMEQVSAINGSVRTLQNESSADREKTLIEREKTFIEREKTLAEREKTLAERAAILEATADNLQNERSISRKLTAFVTHQAAQSNFVLPSSQGF